MPLRLEKGISTHVLTLFASPILIVEIHRQDSLQSTVVLTEIISESCSGDTPTRLPERDQPAEGTLQTSIHVDLVSPGG